MDDATAEIIKIIIEHFGETEFDRYEKIRINKLSENKIFSDDLDVLEYKLDCSLDE